MTEQEASELLKKYKEGSCTPQEMAFMESWYKDLEGNLPDVPYNDSADAVRRVWQMSLDKQVIPQKSLRRYYWPVAAACVLLVASAIYFTSVIKDKPVQAPVALVEDAPAGSNRATLTLANGQEIVLDAAKAGTLAEQAGVTVSKNPNGQLVYVISNEERNLLNSTDKRSLRSRDDGTDAAGIAYNTISTPNGGQYQLILPDGSKVFLNAASSLKYPIRFNTAERLVTLQGEAYFEITKHPDKPFIVSSIGQSVRVLGTHFNVASYKDEPVTTTLAEGKIEISQPSSSEKTILKPGQQCTITNTGIAVAQVNPEDVIAWKDGLFIFSNTELKAVFKQLERWYDVEVDYATVPDIRFYGEVPRNISLLKVLKLIEAGSNVKFRLDGRRIMRQ